MTDVNIPVTAVDREEYKWTEQDTEALILWRTSNEALFSGRRNAAQKGFEEFVRVQSLVGKIEPTKVKRKWENLKQKYKELKAPKTGISTEGGEATAASWKWYSLMDEAMGRRPSITPPVTIDSSSQNVVVVSPPSPREPQTEGETPSKRRREPEWVQILKQVTERDEEREKMCLEKEERREREALEREERKEKEALEREERKDREQLEREEKREKEWLDREEKREREWREWLVKRENENAEREERRQRDFLSLVETMLKNK